MQCKRHSLNNQNSQQNNYLSVKKSKSSENNNNNNNLQNSQNKIIKVCVDEDCDPQDRLKCQLCIQEEIIQISNRSQNCAKQQKNISNDNEIEIDECSNNDTEEYEVENSLQNNNNTNLNTCRTQPFTTGINSTVINNSNNINKNVSTSQNDVFQQQQQQQSQQNISNINNSNNSERFSGKQMNLSYLDADQVFDKSKNIILVEQILKKERANLKVKQDFFDGKINKIKEHIKIQYDQLRENIGVAIDQKQKDSFQILDNYYMRESSLLIDSNIKFDLIEKYVSEAEKLKKQKMRKIEEKIQDSIEIYKQFLKQEIKDIQDKFDLFEYRISQKAMGILSRNSVKQISDRCKEVLDQFSILNVKNMMGKLEIDIDQLINLQLSDTLEGIHSDWITGITPLATGEGNQTLVATSSNDLSVMVTNLSSKQAVMQIKNHTDSVKDVISVNDHIFASACQDQFIRLWDSNNGENIDFLQGHSGSIECLHKINENLFASGSDDNLIYIWDCKEKKIIHKLQGNEDPVNCIQYLSISPDNSNNYSDNNYNNNNNSGSTNVSPLKTHNINTKMSVVFQQIKDREIIISGNKNGNLMAYEIVPGQTIINEPICQVQAHDSAIKSIIHLGENQVKIQRKKGCENDNKNIVINNDFEEENLPIYNIIATCSSDYSIKLWDLNIIENKFVLIKTYIEHTGSVNTLLNINSNRFFMSGSWDTCIKVWDIQKEKSIKTIQIDGHYIECMCYMNDGKTIVTGGSDTKIRIFQIPQEKKEMSILSHINNFNNSKYEQIFRENYLLDQDDFKFSQQQSEENCQCTIF